MSTLTQEIDVNSCMATVSTRVSPAAISQRLAAQIGRHRHDMWFSRSARLRVRGQLLEVLAQSPFVAGWITSSFLRDLQDVARSMMGEHAQVTVGVAPELFDAGPFDGEAPSPCGAGDSDTGAAAPLRLAGHAPALGNGHDRDHGAAAEVQPDRREQVADRSTTRRRQSPGIPRESLRRLEDFVVGPCNRMAFLAAQRLAISPEVTASPLFIHGECGVGKTHLLQGVCRRYAEASGRTSTVRYVTAEQFTNEYIAAVKASGLEAFRKRTRRLELLAIDDVHFLANKVATQSEFLHTLDAIGHGGARVVLASDEHPRQIKRFSQALISRFLSGMVVRIEPPAHETRATLILRLASHRALRLHDGAVQALAARFVGSVRELEGAVTKLAAMQECLGSRGDAAEAGMVLVHQLLQDATWQPRTPVRITAVIDAVCEHMGVAARELSGKSRHGRVVLARSLVAYLGRELTTMSYPEIARALGRQFHSTIHNAAHRLQGQIRQGATYIAADGARPQTMAELVDRLKHDILRGATSLAG